MQELVRVVFFLLVTLLVLFQLVQCRSVMPETIDRQKRSSSNINTVNLCKYRKSSLCNYLRAIDMEKHNQIRQDDQELWRRGVSHFYSNW